MEQLSFSLESFENSAKQGQERFWDAHEFMRSLGYESWASFQGVINRAMSSCTKIGMPFDEAFFPDTIIANNQSIKTYKLTRFACFLVTMHADPKKERVQQAKAVLAAVADALVEQQIRDKDISRIEVRDDLKEAEKLMTSVASEHGLENEKIAIFKDAGFRGMYNRPLAELKSYKNVQKGTLYDYMGMEELAGNLFRTTQTAARIKNEGVQGSNDLVGVAQDVGWQVRKIMLDNSGVKPEDLAIEKDISKVKTSIKGAAREMGKLDAPQKKIVAKR